MNPLAIQATERRGEKLGGGYRTGRRHADFVVDGVPLSARALQRGDLVSCLGRWLRRLLR